VLLNYNIINDGTAFIFNALYAPVIEPGFMKYIPL